MTAGQTAVEQIQPQRYYRLGPFIVDSLAPVMASREGEKALEPRVYELLLLFCRNPGRLITRDEILEVIWRGGIVSDNAISKLIARLREALEDDPKAPRYLQTVARRGYRLSAAVGLTETIDFDQHRSRQRPGALWWVLGIVVGLTAWYLVDLWDGKSASGTLPVKPLTRHVGTEFAPAISPNGRFLAYTRRESANHRRELWLKDLDRDTQRQLEISETPTDLLAWSPDSQRLAMLSLVDAGCRIRALTIDKTGIVIDIQDLVSCDGRSVGNLIFSSRGDALYYTVRERAFEPVQIRVEHLNDKGSSLVVQPPLRGAGNYSIDLSPRGDKLLILAADESYHTQVYVLELPSQTLTAHGRLDHFMDGAIWHHDNESMVSLSAPLSYELVQRSLQGQVLRTLVSTSNRIVDFARHPNGRDYYFASFQMNNDLSYLNASTGEVINLDNTAVYELMPSMSFHSDHYFYLSNRSGRSQAYIGQLGSPGGKQLTRFAESRQFVSMALSPDDNRLLLATYNQLFVVDASSGEIEITTKVNGLILSAGWWDASRLAITRLSDNRPRLYLHDIDTGVDDLQTERWTGAVSDFTQDSTVKYAVDLDGGVYRLQDNWLNATDTGLRLPWVFLLTGINLRAADGVLFYQQNHKLQSSILRFDPQNRKSEEMGTWDYIAGFDAGPGGLMFSHEVSRSGDIVSTADQ